MPSVPHADRASVGDDDNRQVGDVAIDASSASAGQSVADVDADGPEQPPVIYTDHPEGGQVEMPLVTNDDAGQADVGGDSRG
ncbi:hypothetical protein WR25_23378 [Diploscapter pachys]|uniref:Uncharacterized protein n=2 Tax=cellular organisms TaxID=131567 RepID=A0A2A2M534_9BILA|nr:hypothetical protein WR25_23378 [Diploscapter pachys]